MPLALVLGVHLSISSALAQAVNSLRAHLNDPTALIGVLAPSSANGVLAQQQLALAGPMIRVVFLTAERVVQERAEPQLHANGQRVAPAGWLGSTVRRWLATRPVSLGPFADTLAQDGWSEPLEQVAQRLDEAGVTSTDLAVSGDGAKVLRATLEYVEGQRAKDDLVSAAQAAAASKTGSAPLDAIQGVILLGQRRLAPATLDALNPWLATRPSILVDLGLPSATGLPAPVETVTVPMTATLQLVSTPDPVRECREAVRAALDAVSAGVPLDRIAIAMPDPSQAEILRAHLEDARLPARFMVGAALARQPGAQLLRLMWDAQSAPTLQAWHAVLRFPRLRLARNATAKATVGRGRWRRLLADCGGTGTTLVSALNAMVLTRDGDPEARDGLVLAIDRMQAATSDWGQPAPLAEHAERWTRFLEDWLGRAAQDVVDALAPLEGPILTAAEARVELDAVLSQWAPVRGITGRGLLVAEPMGLLGGSFDRVMLLSAVEGSLPRDAREDPLLPDALVNTLGHGLETSADRRVRELRRFRAVLSACTGTLWISIPRVEMLEGRPLLPSSLLLSHLGCSYSELRQKTTTWGSRAHATTAKPHRAVDATEAVLALPPSPRAAALAGFPSARRLMAYQQEADLVRDGGLPSEWTGRVDSRPLPNTGPTEPSALMWQLNDLGAALLGHVGAGRPRVLSEAFDPTDRWTQRRLRLDVVRYLWANPSSTTPKAIDAVLTAAAGLRSISPARLQLARQMLQATVVPIVRKPPATSNQAVGGLHVAGELGWLDGDLVVEVEEVGRVPSLAMALQACALKPSSPHLDVRQVDPTGATRTVDIAGAMAAVEARVASADKHYYPFLQLGPRFPRLALPDDPSVASDELADVVAVLP